MIHHVQVCIKKKNEKTKKKNNGATKNLHVGRAQLNGRIFKQKLFIPLRELVERRISGSIIIINATHK